MPVDIVDDLTKKAMRRKLADKLRHEVEVSKYTTGHMGYRVIFRDGTVERWVFDEVHANRFNLEIPIDPWQGSIISIQSEYMFNYLDENAIQMKRLFKLGYKQWRKGSFWEQRISIHKLVYRLLSEGWVPIEFHHDDLVADLKRLTSVSLGRRHFPDKILRVIGRYGAAHHPGRLLVQQFTDWGRDSERNFIEAWRNPNLLFRAIKRALRKKRDVTRFRILAELSGIHVPGEAICPNVYRTIMKLTKTSESIIADPDPGYGSKAIAATIEQCQYHSDKPMDKLADFLGTEFHPLDRKHYDCVFLDFNFRKRDDMIQQLSEWDDRADIKIIYVPRDRANELPKPDKYIRVLRRSWEDYDFVFYYV